MPEYENIYTYDNIQKLKLAVVPDTLDKREGSVIYTTIAANSYEMARAYAQMLINQNNYFPDTANRENLIRHCSLRGITPKEPTYAKIQGIFYVNVNDGTLFNPKVGDRFTIQDTTLTYSVTKQISDGNWELTCETSGSVGNVSSGVLVPVDEIKALGSASVVGVLDAGEDEEDTESLRTRYMQSLEAQSFSGNKAAYREHVITMENVGACKVFRAYNDTPGHVGLCILDVDYELPSDDLIATVQGEIDPTQDGEGIGFAPIDHICHVFSATQIPIEITLKVTPVNTSTTWENISGSIRTVIANYFKDLIKTWDVTDSIVVRPSQITARLLDVTNILDVTQCLVNGSSTNLQLETTQIPTVGDVIGEIV